MPISKKDRKKNWLYTICFAFLIYLIFQNITMHYVINLYEKQLIIFAKKVSELERKNND